MLLSRPRWSILLSLLGVLGIAGVGVVAWWRRQGGTGVEAFEHVVELQEAHEAASRNGAARPRVRTRITSDY